MAEMGIGMGDDARGLRYAAWGDAFGEDDVGVSARDARSGSSRDFFFVRRDRCTRFAVGAGLPPGDRARPFGEACLWD